MQIVRPFPGETCSGAYEIWRQLNTLQHLITGMKSLEITWFVKASQKTLREEIDKLIAVFSKDDSYFLKGIRISQLPCLPIPIALLQKSSSLKSCTMNSSFINVRLWISSIICGNSCPVSICSFVSVRYQHIFPL